MVQKICAIIKCRPTNAETTEETKNEENISGTIISVIASALYRKAKWISVNVEKTPIIRKIKQISILYIKEKERKFVCLFISTMVDTFW